jgi:HEPN domain-containing protein
MAMKPWKTRSVATATRNRQFAERMLARTNPAPPDLEWAAVAAFYAAVHLVNAYLFELLGLSPSTHEERGGMLARVSDLRRVSAEYEMLRVVAGNARYAPLYTIPAEQLRSLLDTELTAIENAVLPRLQQE